MLLPCSPLENPVTNAPIILVTCLCRADAVGAPQRLCCSRSCRSVSACHSGSGRSRHSRQQRQC